MRSPRKRSGLAPPDPSSRAPEPPAPAAQVNPTWQRLALGEGAARVQATLEIGAADDPLEREAERVAARVAGSADPPSPSSSPAAAVDGAGTVALRRCPDCPPGGRCPRCEAAARGEDVVRLKADPGAAGGAFVARGYLSGLPGRGAPLAPEVREWAEPRFGRDFGGVRVHADGAAARAARDAGARAFTYGRDIVFGARQLQPETQAGRTLLAHELAHTVQQGGAPRAVQRAPDPTPKAAPAPVTSKDLNKQSDPALDAFMRKVYDKQVALWTSGGATYFEGLPDADVVTLSVPDAYTGKIPIRLEREAWTKHVQPMLAAARAALATDQAAGDKDAAGVTGLAIRSGYRSAREQLQVWKDNFPNYIKRTRAARAALPGGEYGDAAADDLARYINKRVFSPGYSPHQRGRTVDVTYEKGGAWARADTESAAITAWRASWFFKWLSANGSKYDLHQNPALDEPWHWEIHTPTPQPPKESALDRLLRLLDELLDWLKRLFTGEAAEAPAAGGDDHGDSPPADAGPEPPAEPAPPR